MAIRGPYESQSSSGLPATLGERLRAVRIRKGCTQLEVATALHTDQATVSGWERDKARPSGAALAALAMHFAVDTALLDTGEGLEAFLQGRAEPPPPRGGTRPVELPDPAGRPIVHLDLRGATTRGAEPFEAMGLLMQAVNEGRSIWIVVD